MKKFSFLFLLLSAFCLIACDDDNSEETPLVIQKGSYVGKLSVEQSNGSIYEGEEVWFYVTKTSGNTMEIVMKDVTFSSQMPMTIDLTIQGISSEATAKEISLYGEDILPIYNGGEVERYKVTNLRGTLTEESFTISMTCGSYPLTFSGVAKEEFVLDETAYIGQLEVDQNDGTVYDEQKAVTILLTETKDKTITMVMENVKFAKAMPITLTMTVNGIVIESRNEKEIKISGEGLVPIAAGGLFEQYTITKMTGTITDKTVQFSLMCGEYPLSFSGKIK